VAGAPKADNSHTVLLSLRNRQPHSFVGDNLSDVMVAFDDGCNFGVAHDARSFPQVDVSIPNPREVLGNARDSMTRVTAQLGSDEKSCDKLGVRPRDAAGREKLFTANSQFLGFKSRHGIPLGSSHGKEALQPVGDEACDARIFLVKHEVIDVR
jgi:hypothetical protein